jgi:hypothetical protein
MYGVIVSTINGHWRHRETRADWLLGYVCPLQLITFFAISTSSDDAQQAARQNRKVLPRLSFLFGHL